MKKDNSKVPPEQLTAYERWELPVVGDSQSKKKQPEIKLPTAAELEAIQKTAYQEGFEQGKAAGKKAGTEEGRKAGLQAGKQEGLKIGKEQGSIAAVAAKKEEINTQLQQLQQVISALQFPLKEIQEQTEEAIVNLVLSISRAVVYRELTLDRQHVVNVVSEALGALPGSDEQAVVYINPGDEQFLKTYLPSDKDFHYFADAGILPGGCRIETRHTFLDFTVEKRFQTVVQQMLARQTDLVERQESHDFTEHMGEMSDFHRDVLEGAAAELPVSDVSRESDDRSGLPDGDIAVDSFQAEPNPPVEQSVTESPKGSPPSSGQGVNGTETESPEVADE